MQIKVEEENDETHDEKEEKDDDDDDEEEEEQQKQRNQNELSELSDEFESKLASLIINKVRKRQRNSMKKLILLFD